MLSNTQINLKRNKVLRKIRRASKQMFRIHLKLQPLEELLAKGNLPGNRHYQFHKVLSKNEQVRLWQTVITELELIIRRVIAPMFVKSS